MSLFNFTKKQFLLIIVMFLLIGVAMTFRGRGGIQYVGNLIEYFSRTLSGWWKNPDSLFMHCDSKVWNAPFSPRQLERFPVLTLDQEILTSEQSHTFILKMRQEELYQYVFVLELFEHMMIPYHIAVYDLDPIDIFYLPRHPSGFSYIAKEDLGAEVYRYLGSSSDENAIPNDMISSIAGKKIIPTPALLCAQQDRVSGTHILVPFRYADGQFKSQQDQMYAQKEVYIVFRMPIGIRFRVQRLLNTSLSEEFKQGYL